VTPDDDVNDDIDAAYGANDDDYSARYPIRCSARKRGRDCPSEGKMTLARCRVKKYRV
jgi:hypothetical protein